MPRNFPFKVLDLRTGASSHLIAILYKMCRGTTASIFGMKERFEVLFGCRQRGQESPCISNYYFDYVLRIFPHLCTNREQRKSGRLDGVEIVIWLLYADDLVLFCKIIAEVKTIMNILNDTCSRFRLTIASPKTKIHCFQSEKMWWTMYRFGQTFSNKDQGSFTDLRVSKAFGNFNEKR